MPTRAISLITGLPNSLPCYHATSMPVRSAGILCSALCARRVYFPCFYLTRTGLGRFGQLIVVWDKLYVFGYLFRWSVGWRRKCLSFRPIPNACDTLRLFPTRICSSVPTSAWNALCMPRNYKPRKPTSLRRNCLKNWTTKRLEVWKQVSIFLFRTCLFAKMNKFVIDDYYVRKHVSTVSDRLIIQDNQRETIRGCVIFKS